MATVPVLQLSSVSHSRVTGTSDAYGCIQVGHNKVYTTTLYRNLNPKWEGVLDIVGGLPHTLSEEATFELEGRHSFVVVTLWDEDILGKDDFLGCSPTVSYCTVHIALLNAHCPLSTLHCPRCPHCTVHIALPSLPTSVSCHMSRR